MAPRREPRGPSGEIEPSAPRRSGFGLDTRRNHFAPFALPDIQATKSPMKASQLVTSLCFVCFALTGLPSAVLPQSNDSTSQNDSTLHTKTVADARFYGLLYPGGGQYYLGQIRRGAAVTAKSISLLGIGTLTLAITNCSFQVSDQGHCVDHRHFGQIAIGSLLIAGGLWIWERGASDAVRDAKELEAGSHQPVGVAGHDHSIISESTSGRPGVRSAVPFASR